jgi:hypothetical protein
MSRDSMTDQGVRLRLLAAAVAFLAGVAAVVIAILLLRSVLG